MSSVMTIPRELLEAVANLRLPAQTDQRLQALMDRNTEGKLSESERAELESLVEVSEVIAPLRARALHLLGRKPA
jgi:hypothetical protein